MRLIVTGAEGFVGQHLGPYLAARGHEVFGTYLVDHPPLDAVRWIHTDLADESSVRSLLRRVVPDGIVHLAAISHVLDVQGAPGRAFAANVAGLAHLLGAAGPKPTVVVVSTGEVYGRVPPERLPIVETEPVAPLNLYGVTKACSEQVAWYFNRTNLARATVVRPFSQMGPGQSDSFVCSSFARQIARAMLGKAPPIVRVGNLAVRRDFMDVRDVVRAYGILVETPVGPGPFNICRGSSVRIGDILNLLIDASGCQIEIQVDQARLRATDIDELVGDPTAFSRATGWQPIYSLEQSLKDTLHYWLDREGNG